MTDLKEHPRPWCVKAYASITGDALFAVMDQQGYTVLNGLYAPLAQFIVQRVNEGECNDVA